jgi:4-hydroxy-tetrahydrodipicolinate synthase
MPFLCAYQLRLVTAIKTPYLPDGRVDLFSYDCLVEQQIAAGVEGLIVGGTTGEGHLMSWDEHIMLIAHTANRCAVCLARAALSR